jgi:hypothetical protein
MRRFYLALGLTTVLASGLGGCASLNGGPQSPASALDAYASGKENLAAGRLGLALMDFQKALQEKGPSVERLNALAATYDRMSRFDLADRAYRQAMMLDPNSPQTLNNLGYSYMLRGRSDLAAAYLAKAHGAAKNDAVIDANLALATEVIEQPADRQVLTASAEASQNAVQPVAVAASADVVPTVLSVSQEPAPEPIPEEAPKSAVVAVPAPSRSAIAVLRPQHGTQIQPVAKGVFQLVTVGEAEPEVALDGPKPTSVGLSASFEIARVIEAMPAVAAVPVSAVQAEPLQQLVQPAVATTPARAVSPAVIETPTQPIAGIINASADAAATVAPASESRTVAAAVEPRHLLASALIEVSNGSGIERSGARFRAYLRDLGVPVKRLTNDASFGQAKTVLYYRDGYFEAARMIASELPMPVALEQSDAQRSDLRLRLGLDSKPFDTYLAAGIITASR